MTKNFKLIFLLFLILSTNCATSQAADQVISATLPQVEPVTPSGGTNGIPGGAIVGIAGGGSAIAGANALAFAPLLLAGLEPNPVICAAAPLDGTTIRANYLEKAIKEQGSIKITKTGIIKSNNKFYFAQNDCDIFNGTYDIDEIILPEELKSASKLKVNITIASEPYNSINGSPELTLGIYKDITRGNLNKKFETQQFLHHYLMKKYELPLKIVKTDYANGIQKMSGIIDTSKFQFINQPLQVAVRYTQGGFHTNLKQENPKVLTYAYLIEFEK